MEIEHQPQKWAACVIKIFYNTLKSKKKKADEINFKCLVQLNVSKILFPLSCNQYKIILHSIFPSLPPPQEMFKLWCVCYMYSTPQCGLVTFLRFDRHMWFVATVPGSTILSVLYFSTVLSVLYFSNHMKNSL